jgi:hypothetical protein
MALLAVVPLWVVPKITAGTQPTAAGTITIESTPTSASVRLDGVELGTTPITTLAGTGTHRVTVSKPGFTEASSTVETKNGETVRLSLALSPVPAAKARPEPAASVEVAQGKPKQRAEWRPAKAKPAPKPQPAPVPPNIQIIDESSEAKVKVDVIE